MWYIYTELLQSNSSSSSAKNDQVKSLKSITSSKLSKLSLSSNPHEIILIDDDVELIKLASERIEELENKYHPEVLKILGIKKN